MTYDMSKPNPAGQNTYCYGLTRKQMLWVTRHAEAHGVGYEVEQHAGRFRRRYNVQLYCWSDYAASELGIYT